MTKLEMKEKVISILDKYNIDNLELREELSSLVGPKTRESEFPNKLDKSGNIVEKYCIWFKKYMPGREFNPLAKAKDKLQPQCKLADKMWFYYGKLMKAKEAEIKEWTEKVLDLDFGDKDYQKSLLSIKKDRENLIKELDKLKEDRKNKVYIEIPTKEDKETK